MSDRAAIDHALNAAGFHGPVKSIRNLSGGCIHTVMAITLDDGRSLVAKLNVAHMRAMFDEEARSLRALSATSTVLVPHPLGVTEHAGRSVLLMTAIAPAAGAPQAEQWRRFGHELAALHQADAGPAYGFESDNHIGSTPQPNSWHDDWVEFNADNRLGFQLALARDNDLLDESESRTIEGLINRLDRLIPRKPRASLLHGDLWSGNAISGQDERGEARIAVIDPASSIGDGWADIAMMSLFGGFPRSCIDAYAQVIGRPDDLESRITVYQLYHVLNHVNIFGRGYAPQAMSLAARL